MNLRPTSPDSCKCKNSFDFLFLEEDEVYDQTVDTLKDVSIIDFGKVFVGTVSHKTFRVKNESQEIFSYTVKRDPDTNPIYQVFDFYKYEGKVVPGDYLKCKVSYSPLIPNEVNLDYFEIKDKIMRLKICVKGQSIGPTVYTSTKTLYFFIIPRLKQTTGTFELKNSSEITAVYQFDVDEKNTSIFQVKHTRGELNAKRHVFIDVAFVPTEMGYYCYPLACLILHGDPVIVELIGIYSCQDTLYPQDIVFTRYPLPLEDTTGFGGYIFDSRKISSYQPPVSLSENYLDFGRLVVEEGRNGRESKRLTLVTCLTNHTDMPIEICWEKDFIFEITPRKVVVPENESVLFECYFYPDAPDSFYSKALTAQIHWIDKRKDAKVRDFQQKIMIPLTVSLRLIGHTFPANTCWIPRIEVHPSKILLPSCIPNRLSGGTFLIEALGHLPVSFKLLPPKKSNFIVKPMVGIVHNYQILVVKLQPDSQHGKVYIEQWSIQLNGQENRLVPIVLKGQTEWPKVTIANRNIISFNAIHPGCQGILRIPMKNISSCQIRYKFLLENLQLLMIDKPTGDIYANETIMLEWKITAFEKMPQILIVRCELLAVEKSKSTVGVPVDTQATVYTKCFYSKLCAIPNSHNFGEIQWGVETQTLFYMFNFGKSPIHFNLIYRQPFTSKNPKQYIKIEPESGTLNPREKYEIQLFFTPKEAGMCEFKIEYQIRLNQFSDQIINDGQSFQIFKFSYYCLYPTLQIEDIAAHNFGPLFSKRALWGMLKIDEINSVLRSIRHNEFKRICFKLPDYETEEFKYYITLVIRNITSFDTDFKFKRRKVCGCKEVLKSIGLSFRTNVYECPHRDMFKMKIADDTILAKNLQMLTLEIKYLEPNYIPMSYVTSLSDNRQIEFFVWINSLPPDISSPSIYNHDYVLELKNVYLGLLEPVVQVFWLYNNSASAITYKVDSDVLNSFTQACHFPVLQCLNVTGYLKPYTSYPIIFDFMPIESKIYRINVPVTFITEKIDLQVIGEGTMSYKSHLNEMLGSMPQTPKVLYLDNPIRLSKDHIVVDLFSVWSTTDKMFFITNMTKDRVFGYSWQSNRIEGVVEVLALHHKGILQPKESHAVLVRVTTYDLPFRLRLELPCKLLDHTQHATHAQSVNDYKVKEEEIKGQFTITEDGISYPINNVVIQPPAQVFYTTLALSLEAISTPDVNLALDVETQLKQAPQFDLQINANRFMKNIDTESFEQNDEFGSLGIKDKCIQFLRTSVETCLSDVIFSDLFQHILEKQNNCNPPYYVQMKMSNNDGFYWRYSTNLEEDIKKSTTAANVRRKKTVEDFLNQPPWPILAEILKELISDSIHEIFQLGPALKTRPVQTFTKPKSRFTCGCYVKNS